MPSALVTGLAAIGAAGLLAGGAAYAAMDPTSQVFGRVLIAGSDSRQLALTYDDGPNPRTTPQLLDLLALNGTRATFFLIGRFVRLQPALARAVAEAGHLIGNHTMTHPRLAFRPAQRIRQELQETNSLLEDVLGIPVHYFRPPYGARRPYVIQAASRINLATVQWNVTASDWKPIGAQGIVANVQAGIKRNTRLGRGSNILLHDGGHLGLGADRLATVAATARILEAHAAGHFVTVDAWDERVWRHAPLA